MLKLGYKLMSEEHGAYHAYGRGPGTAREGNRPTLVPLQDGLLGRRNVGLGQALKDFCPDLRIVLRDDHDRRVLLD